MNLAQNSYEKIKSHQNSHEHKMLNSNFYAFVLYLAHACVPVHYMMEILVQK
jgi:hypothetical protein